MRIWQKIMEFIKGGPAKPRCTHPKLFQKFEWVQETPWLTSSCPDCGMFDSGTVMTFATKEQWLAGRD